MPAICKDSDLQEGQSRGFELDGHSFFIIRQQGTLYAYRNHCPHLGVNLEWMPDQFLDSDGRLIQCAMHGALFLIESGYCVSGPCTGQSLTPLPCEVRDDDIWVEL